MPTVTFAEDTFGDTPGTDLKAHTPTGGSTGGSWLQQPGDTTPIQIGPSGDASASATSNNPIYYLNIAPASTEYSVNVTVANLPTANYFFLCSHVDPATNTYYTLWFDTNGNATLRKMINGSFTDHSATFGGLNNGATINASLTTAISGSSLVLTAEFNGSGTLTWTDSSPIPAGYPGFGFYQPGDASHGNHVQAFSATQVVLATVATPAISPGTGSYSTPQTVSIACATPSAAIYYTLDGTTPSSASTLYTGTFEVSSTTTVRAIGILSGDTNSAIASAILTITTEPAGYRPKTWFNMRRHRPRRTR